MRSTIKTQNVPASCPISEKEHEWRSWDGYTCSLDVRDTYETRGRWKEKGCEKSTFRLGLRRSHKKVGHGEETPIKGKEEFETVRGC